LVVRTARGCPYLFPVSRYAKNIYYFYSYKSIRFIVLTIPKYRVSGKFRNRLLLAVFLPSN